MKQILCCDWLPAQSRWSHLNSSGCPARKLFADASSKSFCSQLHKEKIFSETTQRFFVSFYRWSPKTKKYLFIYLFIHNILEGLEGLEENKNKENKIVDEQFVNYVVTKTGQIINPLLAGLFVQDGGILDSGVQLEF